MSGSVQLRAVRDEDSELIFGWRNDPFIVARSTSAREVTAEEHQGWFRRSLRDERHLLLIAEVDGVPAGLVRFERSAEGQAVVSAYLLEAFTGKGFGPIAIRDGCRQILEHWPIDAIVAFVRTDNAAGQAGFRKAGFAETPDFVNAPSGHMSYILRRSPEDAQAPAQASFRQDDESQVALYSGLLQEHGISHRSLNWGTVASQQRRFSALAGIADLCGKSLLDVGCGLGDLWAWLSARQIEVNYTGADLTPAMVAQAQARFPEREFLAATPETLDASRDFDYIVASGIFYLRTVEPEQFLQRTVRQMFARARQGVAFNSLSTWASQHDAGEFYADPLRTLEFCRTLSPFVTLRHDYLPHDFTIYVYKQQPQG